MILCILFYFHHILILILYHFYYYYCYHYLYPFYCDHYFKRRFPVLLCRFGRRGASINWNKNKYTSAPIGWKVQLFTLLGHYNRQTSPTNHRPTNQRMDMRCHKDVTNKLIIFWLYIILDLLINHKHILKFIIFKKPSDAPDVTDQDSEGGCENENDGRSGVKGGFKIFLGN